MTPADHLIEKADRLSRSSPQEWAEFLDAFAAYTETGRNNCIIAAPEHLAKLQGHAQALTKVLEIFADCRTKQMRTENRKST